MPKKGKGHSKKTRHPGVGTPSQGRYVKSKTNVTGKKKVKTKPALCLDCGEPMTTMTLVPSKGKVKNGHHCKRCHSWTDGRTLFQFPDWF